MRRLMMLIMTTILVGCATIDEQRVTISPPDYTAAFEELSFRSRIELYMIENEADIQRSLQALNLSLPKIVTESAAESRKSIDCLAKNIYWEASNEPIRGKQAVAQVTVNRTEDGRFADDICGVVYERDRVQVRGRTKTICQFSWTCMKVKNKVPKDNEQWDEAVFIAQKFVLDGTGLPELQDALFYHADYVRPRWSRQMVKIEKIGAHIFYREKVKPAEKVVYLASNL